MTTDRCTRPTKKGTLCRSPLIFWCRDISAQQPRTCWMHATEAERVAAQAGKDRADVFWSAPVEQLLASDPACWSWEVQPEHAALALTSMTQDDELAAEDFAMRALAAWQEGRCAVCGERDPLVTDHDHETGLVRGQLCRNCNTNEGFRKGPDTVFRRYRDRSPVHILGVRLRYWNPFTGEHAEPAPKCDPWRDNPMRGIGL